MSRCAHSAGTSRSRDEDGSSDHAHLLRSLLELCYEWLSLTGALLVRARACTIAILMRTIHVRSKNARLCAASGLTLGLSCVGANRPPRADDEPGSRATPAQARRRTCHHSTPCEPVPRRAGPAALSAFSLSPSGAVAEGRRGNSDATTAAPTGGYLSSCRPRTESGTYPKRQRHGSAGSTRRLQPSRRRRSQISGRPDPGEVQNVRSSDLRVDNRSAVARFTITSGERREQRVSRQRTQLDCRTDSSASSGFPRF